MHETGASEPQSITTVRLCGDIRRTLRPGFGIGILGDVRLVAATRTMSEIGVSIRTRGGDVKIDGMTYERHAANRCCDHLVGAGNRLYSFRQSGFSESLGELLPPDTKTRTIRRQRCQLSTPLRHGPERGLVVRQIALHCCARIGLLTR
jgi:hypothetical protein